MPLDFFTQCPICKGEFDVGQLFVELPVLKVAYKYFNADTNYYDMICYTQSHNYSVNQLGRVRIHLGCLNQVEI